MILLRGCQPLASIASATVATIGNFDGFHLGHQEVCKYVIEQSQQAQLRSVLISFEPTPKEFFARKDAPARIYPLRKKFELAREFGFDYYVCLNFTQTLANLPAIDFIKQILHDSLHVKSLVVGDDFKFGHKRSGDIQLLRKMGKTLDFKVSDQNTIAHEHTRISSTLIRAALKESNFKLASKLMGRPFTISGRVFHGDKMGRTIGFPTANIVLRRIKTPITGVFAVTASTDEKNWQGVANIGTRPTVNGKRQQLEVHLFNCQQDLYGQRLHVEFLNKIRDEIKFPSFDDLKTQIELDVSHAQEYFSQRT